MDFELLKKAEIFGKQRRRRTGWKQLVRFLACLVVFCTTYALILPAITQEQDVFCGQSPHVHSAECYIQHPAICYQALICSYDSLDVHVHNPECYDAQGHVLCGQADYIIHLHENACYDTDGTLQCKLPEMYQHEHTDACYQLSGSHIHNEDCYLKQQGPLLCSLQEDVGHIHTGDCFIPTENLLCALPAEHFHGDDCFSAPLLICTATENHSHTDACFTTPELVCTEAENHLHDTNCYTSAQLLCIEPESHLHNAECYAAAELVCAVPEGHVHQTDCFEQVLSCQSAESIGHTHTESCYEQTAQLICTLADTPDIAVLVCSEPEAASHIHSDNCYGIVSEQTLLCSLTNDVSHIHDDSCYVSLELTCDLSEHTHNLMCYSDPTSDIETSDDWEDSFSAVVLTGNPSEDLLTIAETQLGYHESTKNYMVLEDGITIQGYTRYGEWYGTPYSDWNALFVAFCIHYADAGELPYSLDCQDLLDKLISTESDVYRNTDAYLPQPGDLVFIDRDADDNADRIGIVSELIETDTDLPAELIVIEGDANNRVQTISYNRVDPSILSYTPISACLSDDLIEDTLDHTAGYTCGLETHLHEQTCYDLSGALICAQEVHVHDDACLEESPIFFCGLSEHLHSNTCYDASGSLLCEQEEHAHDDACLEEPLVFLCGRSEHLHTNTCYDASGSLRCEQEEHIHDDSCLEAPLDFLCGLSEHLHSAVCYDEFGSLLCEQEEHIHDDSCLEEPLDFLCGFFEHLHSSACYDGSGSLLCAQEEHVHDDSCLEGPLAFLCGLSEHLHSSACYDNSGSLLCEQEEHIHDDACLEEPSAFLCGLSEHLHDTLCYDETGDLLCTFTEHTHTIACTTDLQDLSETDRCQVEQVILAIDALPSYDEIDQKIVEFEELEDYEGEEQWLTDVYQRVARAYNRYAQLPESLRSYVFNKDKLLELEFIWSATPLIDTEIATTVSYDSSMFVDSALFVVYTTSGTTHYAFDGNGNAIPINIDASGVITANIDNKYDLLWSFASQGGDSYLIKNVSTGRYMHAYPNNGSGVTTSGAYSSALVSSGNGVKIRSNTEYARLSVENGRFEMTQNQYLASVYNFGVVHETTIWLDGTNGGLLSLSGAPNTSQMASIGSTFTLPTSWESPEKYSYTLRGWYDVKNSKYYAPGSQITVTESLLFYADWVASSYDIGKFNSSVADTISTNDFITTHVFDYNSLFNVQSQNATVSGGTAFWDLLSSGTVTSTNDESLNFVFIDYDGNGDISYPNNRNSANTSGDVYFGLYNDQLAEILFDPDNAMDPETGTGVLGKTYLGTADHLFQYGSDPTDSEHYGYYYYDSRLNAASYNQSDERFYVYHYLERTSDSARDGGENSYSDFLPLNSPYANTNGKTTSVYSYDGDNGEYAGMSHFMYDTKYNTGNNSVNNVMTNFWFGMSTDFEFYLSSTPGSTDADGNPANLGLSGKPMIFEFSGDDDVWVLIDGELVLDIGGIHGIKTGSINFSTGAVIVDGDVTGNINNLASGRHTLTMYYLERGSSKSNFKLRFNISPRYSLTLRKEDTLTAELLNGAEFSVYTDSALTKPAELWADRESYNRDEPDTNTFAVRDGVATMWGFAAGNTYYIVESKGPAQFNYVPANGIIQMTLNSHGSPDYKVIANPTVGFTVHGYKVNEDEQEAYLVITNTENTSASTEIYVEKKWNDNADYFSTPVTVYLHANGIRIQEITLSENNKWKHTWVNMPKYDGDGKEVVYTVQEATVPGYIGRVETLTESTVSTSSWSSATSFTNGETYLLKTSSGYLSASNGTLSWVSDENTAKTSASTRWIATISGSSVILTNEAGQTLYYGSNAFRASASPSGSTGLTYTSNRLRSGSYYMSTLSNGYASRTRSSYSALVFSLLHETVSSESSPLTGINYRITNTPIGDKETISLTVNKAWDLGNLGQTSMYETLTIQVKLLSNNVDSGLIASLNLRNGWQYTFTNLPKYDSDGEEIHYTLEEVWFSSDWRAEYGEITLTDGSTDAYETTITNVYNMTYQLPETGGCGINRYTSVGVLLIIASGILLLYQYAEKCKKEGNNSS